MTNQIDMERANQLQYSPEMMSQVCYRTEGSPIGWGFSLFLLATQTGQHVTKA